MNAHQAHENFSVKGDSREAFLVKWSHLIVLKKRHKYPKCGDLISIAVAKQWWTAASYRSVGSLDSLVIDWVGHHHIPQAWSNLLELGVDVALAPILLLRGASVELGVIPLNPLLLAQFFQDFLAFSFNLDVSSWILSLVLLKHLNVGGNVPLELRVWQLIRFQ